MIYISLMELMSAEPMVKYGAIAGSVVWFAIWVKSDVFKKITSVFTLPIVAYNGFLMSSFYFNSGTQVMFPGRVMFEPTDVPERVSFYTHYLHVNFGTNHWYMIVFYVFAVVVCLTGFGDLQRKSHKVAKFERESAEAADRIEEMGRRIRKGDY